MALDIQDIKSAFPIFQHYKDSPLVYLDSAATTHKPYKVIKAVEEFYSAQNANIHRGVYELAVGATEAYEGSREKVRKFIGAAKPQEIIFTKGATEGINLVAQSYVLPRLEKGDEVLISAMEHHSNLVPWQAICQQAKARLKVIPMDKSGELNVSAYQDQLSEHVKIVAITHISNTLGTINPIKGMIKMAHEMDIPVLVDAAQSAAHYPINVQEIDADFWVCSGHKMYGPTGIGVLYGKEIFLKMMRPYQYGGDMIKQVSFEVTTYGDLPHKFEAGTPNIAGAIGLGAAIDFINTIGKAKIVQHLQELLIYATDMLEAIRGLQIIGNAHHKSGIISFTLGQIHPHDVATLVNDNGVALRAGHHCTQPIMDFYEIPATSRISFGMYNSRQDIDKLTEAIEDIQQIFE